MAEKQREVEMVTITEAADGVKMWYQNGERYLIEFADGAKSWNLRGEWWLSKRADGTRWWYRNDHCYLLEDSDETKHWCYDEIPQEDGPAIDYVQYHAEVLVQFQKILELTTAHIKKAKTGIARP